MSKRQHYSPEFRAEAVQMVWGQGLSQAEAARRLAIPSGTIANWVAAARGASTPAAPGSRSVAQLEAEVRQLRKELAEVRMEREILKKATAYFAKESLPGTRS
jgi:transposase